MVSSVIFYQFFTAGDPPLIWRLMAINIIMLMLFVVRRAAGKNPMRTSAIYMVQGLLIAANLFVIFGPSILDLQHFSRYMG